MKLEAGGTVLSQLECYLPLTLIPQVLVFLQKVDLLVVIASFSQCTGITGINASGSDTRGTHFPGREQNLPATLCNWKLKDQHSLLISD